MNGDREFEVELEAEIKVELTMVQSSGAEEAAGAPPSEWLFDPADAERDEAGLRNLLGALEALEGDT
ncbi:hypothetical protein [Actinomadura latina]|nr:hypothetical protein [Actinomadura latina]